MQSLRALFARRFGAPPSAMAPLAADGSQRRMFRLRGADGRTAIGVLGPDPDENRAFLAFSRSFQAAGLPVPEVYAADEAAGAYLVEDLGDTTLFRALTAAREARGGDWPDEMTPVYRRVLEVLPRFQVEGGRVADYSVAHPRAAFDRQSMQWDLNYFKYHFLRLAGIRFNEDRLERDFDRLISFLLDADTSHFLYRDFQSRNVMLRGAEPWFIDYQGGRRGALQYDLASLLWDAKAALPEDLRATLVEHYLGALEGLLPVDRERFRLHLRGYVVVRILQALGAYGYRGFYERKTHFLQSVPHAVRNVEHLLATGFLPIDVPELRATLERVCASEALRSAPLAPGAPPSPDSRLTVRVGSFAYRLGYPEDASGHGGGFVFDCRGLRNPGALDAFASSTGLDEPVARFLEADPATGEFLGHALALVAAQVEAYLGRGFTYLSVQFGCTGGQHRSVHLAERLGRALSARFPKVRVLVSHRERSRWPSPRAERPAVPVPAVPLEA